MTTTKPSTESVPNVQYPQNNLPSKPKTPSNPRITGPSLDDVQPHYYQREIKHPMPPHIPTDDANGYKPNAGNPTQAPDTKRKLDRANALAVDKPVRRLKNLHLDRVDLVTAGANQKAYVTLHKFEQEPEDVEKREFSVDARQRHAESGKAMPDGSYPIVNTSDLKNAIQSIGRAKNRDRVISHIKRRAAALGAEDLIPDTFKSLSDDEGDIVKNQVANETTEDAVENQTGTQEPDVTKGKPFGNNNRSDAAADGFGTDDGVDTGAAGGKKKKMGGAQRGRDESATSKSVEGEAPVRKTRTRVARVAKSEFDQIQKAHEELAKANRELAERLEKMENERVEGEFIAKARNLQNLGNANELGRLMHEASKVMKAESYQALERTFKAANAQLEKGDLFASLGREDVDNPTVEDRIHELAKAKLQAGQANTIELAKLAVLHENPDLRDEYQNARRS